MSSARKGAELSRSHTAFGGGPNATGDLNWHAADIDCGRHRRHSIELADGTRCAGVVKGKGVATMFLTSSDGVQHEIMLSDALYVPSYKQSIFSVRAAVKKGVSVNFCPYKCEMKVEATTFDIQERGKLYYVNSVVLYKADDP